MRYHRNTSAARVRAWPPAVQLGHAASELSRATSMLESGDGERARTALLRARELLGVLETSPALPEAWGGPLLDLVRGLSMKNPGTADPASLRSIYGKAMALCGTAPVGASSAETDDE